MVRDYHQKPLRVFLTYYRPHRKLLAIDMCCVLVSSFANLLVPAASRSAMRELLPAGKFRAFFIVMALLLGAYLIKAIMSYIMTVIGHRCGMYMEADMREDLFEHLQDMSFSFFDQRRTGELMSRMTSDLFSVTEMAHHGPENIVLATVTLVGSVIIMMRIQWQIALVLLVLLPISVWFTMSQRRRMTRTNVAVKRQQAEINAVIESGISGVRTAKAFANEDQENAKFRASNERYKHSKREWYRAMGTFFSSMEFTTSALQVVVIALGGLFIMRGTMDYIDLITFSLYIASFVQPIRALVMFMETFTDGMAGFTRFLELMRTEPNVQDAPDAKPLEHVSLRLEPGQTLAVVGPTGGGKTTLCQLLPRFYDVTGGAVRIDGQDVRALRQHSLRQSIGMLQQDVFIFADTIRENIRYGRPNATDAEIIEAAKRAEIHEEILALPNGYDTFVGERGVMLSGGQKQRISIARVFLKNPPVLILDEATSALDSVTEQRIQRSLDMLAVGRTTLIIAHRLSTVKNADRVAVVEGTKIVEQGTPEELLAKNGRYAELCRAQGLI